MGPFNPAMGGLWRWLRRSFWVLGDSLGESSLRRRTDVAVSAAGSAYVVGRVVITGHRGGRVVRDAGWHEARARRRRLASL